ncbi:glucosaminidase domain-containing protein [Vibrio kasasachensis]|uniref:glucosaminidase domain-containing protein n=1 Tax=Vibrio kasasachensis TaxID=2910248 RepID=UPI003D0A93E0
MSLFRLFQYVLTCLSFIISSSSLANTALPISPEQITHPYPDVTVKTLRTAQGLLNEFHQANYLVHTISTDGNVPTYFIENLTNDLNLLPVHEKTSVFIRLLLPTIKAVNDQILLVRTKLTALSYQPTVDWTLEEQQWVNDLMESYHVESHNLQDLLLRIDIIPIGMALAQGIDESGWGTSHFAIKGNSLYGEHLPLHGGKHLSTPSGYIKVAAFENLYQGTASYMHNLNTTRAYEDLWILRRQLREQHNLKGDELVQALGHYSIRGDAYVEDLRALINTHQLDDFENATFDNNEIIRVRYEE